MGAIVDLAEGKEAFKCGCIDMKRNTNLQGLLKNDEIMEDKVFIGVYNCNRRGFFSLQLRGRQGYYGT